MHNTHARNTIRYYVLLIVGLAFLFFSNDFGLLDVQKTAIIMAVGIDKEQDQFIVTSQIAVPQDSKQGKSTEAVQMVSRGKTVADAFEEINAKTGWYPKLVFCKLLVLGNTATQTNCFDALDYFLRDEYFSDNCYVTACDGYAKDMLNQPSLVDATSSVAIGKVLSNHAARVGTVAPVTLREFAIGYFGDSQSGYLPIVTTKPQQEKTQSPNETQNGQSGSNQGQSSGSEQGNGGQEQSSSEGKQSSDNPSEKSVFSAKETALFVRGKRVATLTAEETFAFNAVTNNLQLAPYTISDEKNACTLTIKQNSQKTSLKIAKEGTAVLKMKVQLVAGLLDYSETASLEKLADAGDVPDGIFHAAEKKLSAEIASVFEKARAAGCDIFGIQDLLVKHKPKKYHRYKAVVLQNTLPQIEVRFKNVR